MGLPGGGFFATSKAREKAEDKANQFAREEQARAQAEQRRLEEKFGLTPGELDRQDRTFELEKKRQEELERRAGIPGEDLLKELGPTTRALLERVSGRLGKTSSQIFAEEGGAPASLLLEELSRPGPIGPFEDELNLVLQQVNQQVKTQTQTVVEAVVEAVYPQTVFREAQVARALSISRILPQTQGV